MAFHLRRPIIGKYPTTTPSLPTLARSEHQSLLRELYGLDDSMPKLLEYTIIDFTSLIWIPTARFPFSVIGGSRSTTIACRRWRQTFQLCANFRPNWPPRKNCCSRAATPLAKLHIFGETQLGTCRSGPQKDHKACLLATMVLPTRAGQTHGERR